MDGNDAIDNTASVTGRLDGKTAVVVGGGQTPGETIGNGRATALLFAREGARVLVVDRQLSSAEETCELIASEGGVAEPHRTDIVNEDECRQLAEAAVAAFGRIDILHNNVGIGAGDSSAVRLTEEVWNRIIDTNLKGMWLTCKHVLPVMREQHGGAIVNISSLAAVASANIFAYKISKAGVNALTENLAIANARHGIRVNAIMPGLMDTPMAVDAAARAIGASRDDVANPRHQQVPLGGRMGSAWDVAYAALYLASDEAKFVTGAILPVDGGQGVRIG